MRYGPVVFAAAAMAYVLVGLGLAV